MTWTTPVTYDGGSNGIQLARDAASILIQSSAIKRVEYEVTYAVEHFNIENA